MTDCNDRNGEPFSNEKIQYEICIVIVEEEAEANNVTADTFCQTTKTPNIQGENANDILKSERINNLDALAETLKVLTIIDTGYYNSDKNGAEGDPASNPKVYTQTSDRKKRKVTDTNNRKLQQKN